MYKMQQQDLFLALESFLIELHWLPVSLRIDHKILLLTFKCIYGLAPTYLSDLISIKSNSLYNRRSTGMLLLDHPLGKDAYNIGSKIIFSSSSETLEWPTSGASSSNIT